MRFKYSIFSIIVLLTIHYAHASFEAFKVDDIQVRGLQRIDLGAFFADLPLKVGEVVDQSRVPFLVRALYRTGAYENISVTREGNTLILIVEERPIISDIDVEGNSDLKTDDLLNAMEQQGFAKGEVYKPATLEAIAAEVEKQYYSHGKYSVRVKTTANNLSRNRVKVKMEIDEGKAAKIEEINIVGNTVFDDKTLLNEFELSSKGFLSLFSSGKQYAAEKLKGDMEKLEDFYLNRGYLNFRIESRQVSISPDRTKVFITINIREGEVFKVTDVKFAGELVLDEDLLRRFVPIRTGNTYSGAAVTYAEEEITKILGYQGYAFAEVKGIPKMDEEKKEVELIFTIEPKQRTYIRRISISGNESTDDVVFRREVRMLEGQPLSTQLVERSKIRMQRLPYVEDVTVETPKVPGTYDQVDLEFTVKERSAGTFTGGLGYGGFQGLSLNLSVDHSNFLGTGNSIGVFVRNSRAIKNINFSYRQPYFTQDGVSLAYSLSFSETDFQELNINRSSQKRASLGATFGWPLTETSRISVGGRVQTNELNPNSLGTSQFGTNSQALVDLFSAIGKDIKVDETIDFDLFELSLGWTKNTLNRGTFPTRGTLHQVQLEATVPGSDLEFYKIAYDLYHYIPIKRSGWVFLTRMNLSFGQGYGNGDRGIFPYFENFRSISTESLRGFEDNVVGALDILRTTQTTEVLTPDGDTRLVLLPEENDIIRLSNLSLGGNAKATASFELIFPLPFAQVSTLRTSFFLDVGNVWDTNFEVSRFNNFRGRVLSRNGRLIDMPDFGDPGTYRASAGFAVQWLAPVGPISISIGKPLREQSFDKFENLQFNIGRTF